MASDSDNLAYLLVRFEAIKFSKNEACKLIGREQLERCVGNGRIRRERPNATSQHGKWYCNAADVIRELLGM